VKVRLGLLREYLYEAVAMSALDSPSAPGDPDAGVPGHRPSELPGSAALDDENGNPPKPGEMDEEAWVPGRWFPNGLEAEPYDHERLGDPTGQPSGAEGDLDETDDRMIGDGKGNGIPDPDDSDDDLKMSPHLKGDEEKTSLGSPPEEKPEKGFYGESVMPLWLRYEIREFFKQEKHLLLEYPPGAGMVDPTTEPKGFYTDFDMSRDHHDGEDIDGFWYASPARPMGTNGDFRREEDPQAQLKMHPRDNDPTTVHPSVMGMDGVASRRAPEIPELSGGSDTSKMLGANAKPGGGDVDSEGEPEEGEEGEDGEAAADAAQGEGEEQG